MKKWMGLVIIALMITGCSSSASSSSAESNKETENSTEEQKTEVDNEKAAEAITTEETPVSAKETAEDYGYHTVDDYSVYTATDYSHIDSDCVLLGNDEKLTVTIEAEPNDVDENDFIYYFENDSFTITVADVEHKSDKSVIKLEITGDTVVTDEFTVVSVTDYLAGDDDGVYCVSFSVRKLDSEQGRVVYLSETGEKYHYSQSCLGGGITTTLFDAEAYEYEPCQKCVN